MIQPTEKDRIMGSLRKIIAAEMPNLAYGAIWEYSITSVNGDGTVNGRPTDSAIQLPPLSNVPFTPRASGGTSKPTVGNSFLVEFLNFSGTKYGIVSANPLVQESNMDAKKTVFMGLSSSEPVEIGPDPSNELARNGDSITIWFPRGVIDGDVTLPNGSKVHFGPTEIHLLNPCPGLISGGTSRVRA